MKPDPSSTNLFLYWVAVEGLIVRRHVLAWSPPNFDGGYCTNGMGLHLWLVRRKGNLLDCHTTELGMGISKLFISCIFFLKCRIICMGWRDVQPIILVNRHHYHVVQLPNLKMVSFGMVYGDSWLLFQVKQLRNIKYVIPRLRFCGCLSKKKTISESAI